MTTGPDGITDAYRPLHDYLMAASENAVALSLGDIESIVGFELPERASQDDSWWSSTPRNSWARAWLRAGREVAFDVDEGTAVFSVQPFKPQFDLELTIKQRRREEEHARSALRYPPSEVSNLLLGWWEPHVVYLLRKPAVGLFKVGLTIEGSRRRIKEQTARGRADVFSTLVVPNRWAAKLVETAVLVDTDHVRKLGDPFNHHNGQTEHWDDSVPPPGLALIACDLSEDEDLRYWSVSCTRTAANFAPL